MGARPALTVRRESVRAGTLLLAAARVGRFSLGFLATLLVAHLFGTSRETEAFFVASVLPIVFMDWAGNVLKVGFIPTHADIAAREGPGPARAVALEFAVLTSVLFLVLAALTHALAPFVVGAMGVGFDPATHRMSVGMLRTLTPAIFLGGVFLVTETLLNAGEHFSSPARARVAGRAAVIVGLVALAAPLGARCLPIAYLAGSVVTLVATGPVLVTAWRGVRVRLRRPLPGTRAVLALLGPALAWMMLDQLKFVVDQAFASALASGQLAALNYAFRVVQVTISVTAGAYLTALFPTLSNLVAAGGPAAERAGIAGRRVLVVTGLFAVVFAGAALPLVRLVLERGAFGPEATRDTAGALVYYAPALVLVAVNMLLKILLFLQRRAGPILLVGGTELGLNVLLDAVLVRPLGIRGLALATSLTTLVVTLTLVPYLSRRGLLDWRPAWDTARRLAPGALSGFWIAERLGARLPHATFSEALVALALSGGAAALAYGGAAWLLGVRDAGIAGILSRRKGSGMDD